MVTQPKTPAETPVSKATYVSCKPMIAHSVNFCNTFFKTAVEKENPPVSCHTPLFRRPNYGCFSSFRSGTRKYAYTTTLL